jgi:uncharacterized membrane protein YkvI
VGLIRLFIPGLVFQAVVIGAGYATGRELVEFFMSESLATGLVGMATSALIWSVVLAISFEVARSTNAIDYKSFLRTLVGRYWFLYEICWAALLIVVLSVLGSAVGEIVSARLGWHPLIGVLALMIGVAALVAYGTRAVERFLTVWSVILYGLFAAILALCLARFGPAIADNLQTSRIEPSWFQQGVSYAGYNLAVVPGILYVTGHMRSRRDALVAGLMAGPIAMLPAILFFLAMTAFWPTIRAAPVPIDVVLDALEMPSLSLVFYIALFGVAVKTGAAFIHAVNERLAAAGRERGADLPGSTRMLVALAAMVAATVLAEAVGIVDLIARGYALLTVAFMVVFVAPLIVVGGRRIVRAA